MPFITSLAFLKAVGFCFPATVARQQILLTAGSNYVKMFEFSETTGRGTEYASPVAYLSNNGSGADIDNSGSNIAISRVNSPYLAVFPWTNAGAGTQYSSPATLPTAASYASPACHPNGSALAVSTYSASNLATVYAFSSSGFGTKFADPSLGTSSGYGYRAITFNLTGTILFIGDRFSPYISAYNWSAAGFGTKLSDPSSPPLNFVMDIKVNKNTNGLVLCTANNTEGSVLHYTWAGGFGTKSVIMNNTNGRANKASFNFSASVLMVSAEYTQDNNVRFYSVSGSTYTFTQGFSPVGNNGSSACCFAPKSDSIYTYAAYSDELRTSTYPGGNPVGSSPSLPYFTAMDKNIAISNFT